MIFYFNIFLIYISSENYQIEKRNKANVCIYATINYIILFKIKSNLLLLSIALAISVIFFFNRKYPFFLNVLQNIHLFHVKITLSFTAILSNMYKINSKLKAAIIYMYIWRF